MSETTDQAAATPGLRDRIKNKGGEAKKPERGVVLVPEWNETIYVRRVKSSDLDAFDRETIRRRKKEPDRVRGRERLVILTAEDQAGRPVFTAKDEDWLADEDVSALLRVFKLACRMNGLSDDDEGAGGNS